MNLQSICRRFFPECNLLSSREIEIGHINRTLQVTLDLADGPQDFLLQALNTYVFKQPELVMENIVRVTAHQNSLLRFYPAADSKFYTIDEDGFWRLCNFIPSLTYSSGENLSIVAEAARAFGQFQQKLSDFDASLLHETIPNFHNTRSRFADLRKAAEADSHHRAAEVQEELSYLFAHENLACTLTDLHQQGKLPLRVTHNDTKINNVLFDKDSGRALTVVDLDTVMPGLIGHDFGDALRSAANTQAEDCPDYDKISVNMDVVRIFTDGYLSVLAPSLTEMEIDTLALSAYVLTMEQTARFLTDYLQGDVYFRTAYPLHNLVRTRSQLALAKAFHAALPQMQKIVAESAEKYR